LAKLAQNLYFFGDFFQNFKESMTKYSLKFFFPHILAKNFQKKIADFHMAMYKHMYKIYKCSLGFDIILDSFDCDHTHEIQILPSINMHLKHTISFVLVLDVGVASKKNPLTTISSSQ